MEACRFGKGKTKVNSSFKPVVANALFFTSLSYYRQLESDKGILLDNAIKYAGEAVAYNPNLSPCHYYLAIYYSLTDQKEKMKLNLEKAIELNPKYVLDLDEEKPFDKNRSTVNDLLAILQSKKETESSVIIESAKKCMLPYQPLLFQIQFTSMIILKLKVC